MKHNLIVGNRPHTPLLKSFFDKDDFFTPMESIFDNIFHDNFPELVDAFNINFDKSSYPKINLKETDSAYTIIAEIPGIEKENVDIEYDNKTGLLKIKGDKKLKNEDSVDEKGTKWIIREIKSSSFSRCFYINDTDLIDSEKITADYKNNYLTIVLPKRELKIEPETKQRIKID